MKKSMLFLMAGMFLFSLLTSCGGGIDSEVKDLAEKRCECKKLEKEDKEDDATKCYEEMEKTEDELEKKMKDLDEKEQDRLEDLYDETYKACKK